MKTVQVEADHFTAAFVLSDDGIVTEAAPILKWLVGKEVDYVRAWAQRSKFKFTVVDPMAVIAPLPESDPPDIVPAVISAHDARERDDDEQGDGEGAQDLQA